MRYIIPAGVLIFGVAAIALVVVHGWYAIHCKPMADRYSDATFRKLLWRVKSGPHAGRSGRIVSHRLFDFWVDLNVDSNNEDAWVEWQERKANGYSPRMWFGQSSFRTFITVRGSNVEVIGDEHDSWVYDYDFHSTVATDWQVIGFVDGFSGDSVLSSSMAASCGQRASKYDSWYERGRYCGAKERELCQSGPVAKENASKWFPIDTGMWIRWEHESAERHAREELEKCDPGPFQEAP